MARKIVFTSGKGGVGKTTLVSQIGRKLASLNNRVLVIDADFSLNNLDLALGVENFVVYDLFDALSGNCRIRQAFIKDKYEKNLYILPSDKLSANSSFSAQNIKTALLGVSKLFDFILIDSPAGIDNGFKRAVLCADEAVVVINSSFESLRDADKVINFIKSYDIDKVSLILNRARGDLMLSGYGVSAENVKDLLKCSLLGVVPDSDALLTLGGEKLSRLSSADKAISMICNKILTGSGDIYDPTLKYKGFFGSIKRSLRKSN